MINALATVHADSAHLALDGFDAAFARDDNDSASDALRCLSSAVLALAAANDAIAGTPTIAENLAAAYARARVRADAVLTTYDA